MTHASQNAAARERVLALVAPLSDAQMAVAGADGWTIAAQLAHLAFWDRVHVARLRAALESGTDLPAPFPEGAIDAVNDAGLHGWRSIPGEAATRLFAEASAEVDAYLATLSPTVVEIVRSAGLSRHVERFRHRTEHGAAIEEAIRDL
ncbi:MAG: DinB family protein [Actinomycetota bacterium]